MLNKLDPTSSVTGAFNPPYCEPRAAASGGCSPSAKESSLESAESHPPSCPQSYPGGIKKELEQLFLPLLTQIFQQKTSLDVSPTRLKHTPDVTPEITKANLQQLAKDLTFALDWLQLCLKQTEKALEEPPRGRRWLEKLFR